MTGYTAEDLAVIADHGPPPLGEWWVCHYPERPIDAKAAFVAGCPRCLIALEAARIRDGDFPMVQIDIGRRRRVNSADVVAHWQEP